MTTSALDQAYVERLYAGVLGKIIGVYLGRPFEGWDYAQITEAFGQIDYYVHDRVGQPLIVTDDDITGTFTFLRAMPDHGNSFDLTPAQAGETWLNYLIENRTILWWGGLGNSTEHTAYLRLKQGFHAPESGSAALNTTLVAEQIGAQIFIDGWGMIMPGEPRRAADLARRVASVSHDGEALHAAAVVAAMEAQAFVDQDTERLVDTALDLIPRDSITAAVIEDVRNWHRDEPDWRETRERIEHRYGYDQYGGNVHIVPNHAVVQLGFLYGDRDFQRAMTVANTAGWDTDCNSGNVGALVGIQVGLEGLDAGADWRGPVNDRLYLPTADGSRAITDAVRETLEIATIARAVRGLEPDLPKDGARFNFSLPGSTQGFAVAASSEGVAVSTRNAESSVFDARVLAVDVERLGRDRELLVTTPTFIPPDARAPFKTYELIAVPTLYPHQTVTARVARTGEARGELRAGLVVGVYTDTDDIAYLDGGAVELTVDAPTELTFEIPDTGGQPVASVGIRVSSRTGAGGRVELDRLGWGGTPNVTWRKPKGGRMWSRAWVDSISHFPSWSRVDGFPIVQDSGTGLLSTGGPWSDVRVEAAMTVSLTKQAGIAARVVGLHRYVALVISEEGEARIVVRDHDREEVLASIPIEWRPDSAYELALELVGGEARAWVGGVELGPVDVSAAPHAGGIALLVSDGRADTDEIRVSAPSAASV